MAVPKDRVAKVYLTPANKTFVENYMPLKNTASKSAAVNKIIDTVRNQMKLSSAKK